MPHVQHHESNDSRRAHGARDARGVLQRVRTPAAVLCLLALNGVAVRGEEPVGPNNGGIAAANRSDAVATWIQKNAEGEKGNFLPRRESGNSQGLRSRPTGRGDSSVGTLSLLWPLCVVLGCICAGAYAVRRWMPSGPRGGPRNAIQVLGRQYLSSKQSVCLIRLGKRIVCLGVTPEHISTLAQIEDPEEIASLVAQAGTAAPGSFTSVFTRFANSAEPGIEIDEPATAAGIETRARTAGEIRGLLARVQQLSGSKPPAEPVQSGTVRPV